MPVAGKGDTMPTEAKIRVRMLVVLVLALALTAAVILGTNFGVHSSGTSGAHDAHVFEGMGYAHSTIYGD